MDITQVLANWKNENDTRLDQLKVDNPNLYNAIGGALSFLSKKYGGENIVLSPIEEVETEMPQVVVEDTQNELEKYQGFVAYLRGIQKLVDRKGKFQSVIDYTIEYPIALLSYEDSLNANKRLFEYLERENLIYRLNSQYDLTNRGRLLLSFYPEIGANQEVTPQPNTQTFTQEDMDMNILKNIIITRTKLGKDPSAFTIWKDFDGLMFVDYDIKDTGNGNRNFMDDLQRLVNLELVWRIQDPNDPNIYRYKVPLKGYEKLKDYLSSIGQLDEFLDQRDSLRNASPQVEEFVQVTPVTPTPSSKGLRPSPTDSATMYTKGTKMVGNDGNYWMVIETKNGVKRWNKVGEVPSDVVEEEEIKVPAQTEEEEEIDWDTLENMLDDESLDFNISDEDLDNLEF